MGKIRARRGKEASAHFFMKYMQMFLDFLHIFL